MTKNIIVDRKRSIIVIDGTPYFYDRIYAIGDHTRREHEIGSSPYICYNVQKLATADDGEYSVYRADFCEIHGSGEMSRYFTREEA